MKNTIKIKIGTLFNLLAVIEAAKGRRKLAEEEESNGVARFKVAAGISDAEFVSESDQKLASVVWQTRKSISAELLVAAGVSQATIDACQVESKPFAVFRIH
jgi:hypothetical protein